MCHSKPNKTKSNQTEPKKSHIFPNVYGNVNDIICTESTCTVYENEHFLAQMTTHYKSDAAYLFYLIIIHAQAFLLPVITFLSENSFANAISVR